MPVVWVVVSHTCRARGADNGSATTTAISPQVVREAMKQRASHWGAMRQEDAHEFFTALLNALADEVQQAQVGGGRGCNVLGECAVMRRVWANVLPAVCICVVLLRSRREHTLGQWSTEGVFKAEL